MTDETYGVINPIAGYPLTILMILRYEDMINHERVMEITEISLPTTRKHLKKLCKLGYLESIGRFHSPMYRLTENGSKLPFMDYPSVKFLQMISITNIYIDSINKNKEIKNSNRKQSEKLFQINQEAFVLLKGVGVGEPALSRYAAKKHITPEFVQWRIDQWREHCKKGKKYTVGWLITSLDRVDDPPKPREVCPLCNSDYLMYKGTCMNTPCVDERKLVKEAK